MLNIHLVYCLAYSNIQQEEFGFWMCPVSLSPVYNGFEFLFQVSPWICPITGLEMNGKFRFVFDWTDGRVISGRFYYSITVRI